MAAAVAAASFFLAPSFAADAPPPPTARVTDGAGFLSEPARQALDARLRDYETATGHQFLVWIGRSTEGVPIEDFAVRAFEAWGVGRRGKDDGLVLFIFAEDRAARFEVGYGLEGSFPDVAAARVIRDVLTPRLQAGDREGAVAAAIEAATSTIASDEHASGPEGGRGLEGPASRERGRGERPLSTPEKVVLGLVVLGFLIILMTNPALALYLLQVIASGGGGSGRGGWGGGGGWSGGGGRSGGGGASGSW